MEIYSDTVIPLSVFLFGKSKTTSIGLTLIKDKITVKSFIEVITDNIVEEVDITLTGVVQPEVNISPKTIITAQPLKKALHKNPEWQ